ALVKFVSNEYIKIKTRHKKNPANYSVYKTQEGNYKLVKNEDIAKPEFQDENYTVEGNLKELYLELPTLQEDVFTDGYSGTMKIAIGNEVSIDRKLCDENRGADCSRGLHYA